MAKSLLKWLKFQDVYTLHKLVRRRFPRRKTIIPGANFQMLADLIDISSLKQYIDNFKYILVVIDVFSKKGFISFLKTKTSSEMIRAFEKVLPKIGRFQKLQTNLGSEFFNRPFQAWLKRQNIEHFHTNNFDTKSDIQSGSEVKGQLQTVYIVWIAICCDALFRSFFFPCNVTSESYTTILRKIFTRLFQIVPILSKDRFSIMEPQRIMQTWLVSGCLTLLVIVG